MVEVSDENRTLGRLLRGQLGGQTSVNRYGDDNGKSSTFIVTAPDNPVPGVTTFGTIGLSDCHTNLSVDGKPLGVELLMAVASAYEQGGNVIATCAFNAINSGVSTEPYSVHRGAVSMYYPRCSMQHLLLVHPFLWDVPSQYLDSKVAAWLQAVPIGESELTYLEQAGPEALESKFSSAQIDVFNLDRLVVC